MTAATATPTPDANTTPWQVDYTHVIAKRAARLQKLRENPDILAVCHLHYKNNPWDFIQDWGVTFDPRNIARGTIATVPFILWPRQVEFLKWMHQRWQTSERGLVDKSRDCGVTWLCVGFAVAMWRYHDGFIAGFGSRKEELVDKYGDDKSIFEKVRFFLRNLPEEFLPDRFNPSTDISKMRISNPANGSSIIGESGDNIGRGGRSSIYIVDEAAFVEHQLSTDAALSQNTQCQIDVSTSNGTGTEFDKKRRRFKDTDKLFVFDWRDDPRKDDAWYQKQCEDLDPLIVAREIDRDPEASAEGVFIPAEWVRASIDAHITLGFEPIGLRVTAFDPADVGDAKATVSREGPVITQAEEKKDGDITHAIPWATRIADRHRADVFTYDADGMGAPTMKVALNQGAMGRMPVVPFYGSAGVIKPDEIYGGPDPEQPHDPDNPPLLTPDPKTNKEKFANYRAQAWTMARDRFEATYKAVQARKEGRIARVDPDTLISIDSTCKNVYELVSELSRPRRVHSKTNKILVESKAEMKRRQVESPNLADAAVMVIATERPRPPDKRKRRRRVRAYRDPLRIR